jgi:protein-S-isoprenylcysteine O-methyltransferase Ste14
MVNVKLSSLVATIVLMAAAAALLIRHALVATHPALIGAQVLAVLLMIWARITFGARSFHAAANPTEGGLVTTGPYRWIRHPIYAAIIVFLGVGVASHPSLVNVAIGIVAYAATAVRIMAEERLVTERYPEYAAYAVRTKRIIPFVL